MVRPRIVTARRLGLTFRNVFGALGPEIYVTGHHSATPIRRGSTRRIRRAEEADLRNFHRQHRDKGWGGIGYFFALGRDGTLYCLRPTALKGAHVGGWNSGNIGIVCLGTVGDKPTRRQRATLRWLLANAHTEKMPRAHRTDRDLRRATLRGHNDWPGHTGNECPGTFKPMYRNGGKA